MVSSSCVLVVGGWLLFCVLVVGCVGGGGGGLDLQLALFAHKEDASWLAVEDSVGRDVLVHLLALVEALEGGDARRNVAHGYFVVRQVVVVGVGCGSCLHRLVGEGAAVG